MLKLKNINLTFNRGTINEFHALQDINLTIEEGSFVVILGTNGSGKSTLLNTIAGTHNIDKGTIELDKINITKLPEHKRATYIGRVFQNPFSGTAPDMSIAENIAMAAKRGFSRGLAKALRTSAINQYQQKVANLNMNLEDRLDTAIGKLSGGQRQALTLLMATWNKPKILLLDEHTAALDPKTANIVIKLTEKIIRENQITTLMVTHSMQQAVNLGNRIIMMDHGKIVFDKSGEEKKQLKVNDLLNLFDELRRKEQIDHSVSELLQKQYI